MEPDRDAGSVINIYETTQNFVEKEARVQAWKFLTDIPRRSVYV